MSTIVFDLDGTLVHSAPDVLSCLVAALREVGLPCAEQLPDSIIGPPLHEMMSNLGLHCSPAEVQAAGAAFRRLYDASPLDRTLPYDGALALLQDLAEAGHSVFLATNKPCLPTSRLVDRFFPGVFLDVCCIDSLAGERLSKLAMLELLSNRHALRPSDSIMVGDGTGDLVAGRSLGWTSVAVSWGYGRKEELNAECPDHLVDSLVQLKNLLFE